MHMDQMKACRTHANMPCVLPCMPIDMSTRLDNKISVIYCTKCIYRSA